MSNSSSSSSVSGSSSASPASSASSVSSSVSPSKSPAKSSPPSSSTSSTSVVAPALPSTPSLDDPVFRRFVEERDASEFRRRQALKSKLPKHSGPSTTTDDELKALGFTREQIEEQKAKRKAWMKAEEEENERIRKAEEEKAERSSNRALRVVLLLWFVLILAIFAFVFNTLLQSHDVNKQMNRIQTSGQFTPRQPQNPFEHAEL